MNEYDALDAIRDILSGFPADSAIGAAFSGCISIAEFNLECNTRNSLKKALAQIRRRHEETQQLLFESEKAVTYYHGKLEEQEQATEEAVRKYNALRKKIRKLA